MGVFFRFLDRFHRPPFSNTRKRGQALIEAAIITPIVILLLLGILDVGRMINAKIVITNAAREGANYLSYHPGADITTVVNNEARLPGLTNVAIEEIIGCCTLDNPVTVKVKATFNGILFKNTIIMSNPVTMMVQESE